LHSGKCVRRLGERGQAEDRPGRVAARVGDEAGGADRVAVQFRQAVDGLFEVGLVGRRAVHLLVQAGRPEAVIGREVDDTGAGLQQGPGVGHAGGVREGQEDDVAGTREGLRVGRGDLDVQPAGELREEAAQGPALLGQVGQGDDLHGRMAQDADACGHGTLLGSGASSACERLLG